jgi:hypothetical protein
MSFVIFQVETGHPLSLVSMWQAKSKKGAACGNDDVPFFCLGSSSLEVGPPHSDGVGPWRRPLRSLPMVSK